MSLDFQLTVNVDDVIREMQKLDKEVLTKARAGLRTEAELVMTVAKKRTPVKSGNLRSSGRIEELANGNLLKLIFDPFYAFFVHEIPAKHAPGTGTKFLESALKEAVPGMAKRIAKRIQV